MNYAYLRQLGIERIKELAGMLWTDHNIHDPGISILETLCYAITDLGNRLGLPIDTLLSSQEGLSPDRFLKIFQLPEEALPNGALTENDLRKVLIDIEGIKQVYLSRAIRSKKDIYIDPVTRGLTFNPTSELVHLRGLYIVQLELKDVTNLFHESIEITLGGSAFSIDLSYAVEKYWDELLPDWMDDQVQAQAVSFFDLALKLIELDDNTTGEINYFSRLNVTFDNGHIERNIPVRIRSTFDTLLQVSDPLKTLLKTSLSGKLLDSGGIIREYKNNLEKAKLIIDNARNRFYKNRSLCEDLVSFRSVRIQEIAINGEFVIHSEGEQNEILAKIFLELENAYYPEVDYYSLTDLYMNENRSLDTIIQGPSLETGFIKDEELGSLENREALYISDLIQIIMLGNSVTAINSLSLSSFVDNVQLISEESNCLNINNPKEYQIKFSLEKSKISFLRNENEIIPDLAVVRYNLEKLKQAGSGTKNDLPSGLDQPKGEVLNLQEFSSIQYDIPPLYGVGKFAHSNSDPSHRRAQTNQLQGFLLLFDLVLSNFNAQIANFGSLFTLEDGTPTYFTKGPFEVPGVKNLLSEFLDGNLSWEEFISDQENGFMATLRQSSESVSKNLERRNRILNYMLSWFAESYPDFNELRYSSLNYYYLQEKSLFFKNHQAFSQLRASAFSCISDATASQAWNTDNVSGLKTRISALLGIREHNRRSLLLEPDPQDYFDFITVPSGAITKHAIQIMDDSELCNLESILVDTLLEAESLALEIIQYGSKLSNYGKWFIDNDKLITPLKDNKGAILANISSSFIPTAGEAIEEADLLRSKLVANMANHFLLIQKKGEGFFLLEHILLRPRTDSDLILSNNIGGRFTPDPYSLSLSFVFPTGFSRNFSIANGQETDRVWPSRNKDQEFKNFVESLIMKEVPTHILPFIFWLDKDTNDPPHTGAHSLDNFEHAYKNWLLIKLKSSSTDVEISLAQNHLVETLNKIFSEITV